MERILSNHEDLISEEERRDLELQRFETGNQLAARAMEGRVEGNNVGQTRQEPRDTLERPIDDTTQFDTQQFPLSTYEEGEDRSPKVTGRLIEEEFSEDRFTATYDFRRTQGYEEERPLFTELESEQIGALLETDTEGLEVDVSTVKNGLVVTATYKEPESATEAVYEVNRAIAPLDEITDVKEAYLQED